VPGEVDRRAVFSESSRYLGESEIGADFSAALDIARDDNLTTTLEPVLHAAIDKLNVFLWQGSSG
jgi:hypothetical protein